MSAARLSPRARADMLSAIRWIAHDNPAAARGLRISIARAAKRIGRHEEIGVVRPDLATDNYRFVSLTGFPYLLIYNVDRKPPMIVRILHGARDLPAAL